MKTKEEVLIEIANLAQEKKISFMDACIDYCEKNNMEEAALGDMIRGTPKIKAIIRQDAEDLNYLPKTNRLPV